MHIDTLRAIEGIEIFPVISLVLFVLVFSIAIVRTARLDRESLARHARLPIDDHRPVAGDVRMTATEEN